MISSRYWIRLDVTALLSSSVTLSSLLALNRSTNYAEIVAGEVLEFNCKKGQEGIASIEALTDAGTANLLVNCMVDSGGTF